MTFYVYMLRCRDGTLYTGYTNDTAKRIRAHQQDKASKYTRSRLPVALVAQWSFATKSEAMRYEARLKSMPRTEKLAAVTGAFKISAQSLATEGS